jgi:UDP-N-acetylmuramoyl-tripeptide--D-alanyl-D-alanine ligase
MKLDFRLQDLAEVTGGRVTGGDPGLVVERVSTDTRTLEPGDLFIALQGPNHDGHNFAANAVSLGAAGVLVSRPAPGLPAAVPCLEVPDTLAALQAMALAHRRRFPIRVIGITGSNGKTTTKEMTARVLAKAGRRVLSTKGNLNSQIGLPLMMLELESLHTHAVLEMGASQKGEIGRLAALAGPEVGVITGIGKAHLEFFGSLEGVLDTKWALVASLPKNGTAILNADDPLLMNRRPGLECPVLTFGLDPHADVRAENIRLGPETVFDLCLPDARQEVRLSLPGLFNVRNALAAAAVGYAEKVGVRDMAEAFASFIPPKFRMQVHKRRDNVVFVLDAYNANPTSMRASLESFAAMFPDRPKWAVLGSMKELGPGTESEHAALGETLASLPLDGVFFVGEEGSWVEKGLRARNAVLPLRLFARNPDVRQALAGVLAPGAAVLFKASRSVKLEEVFEPLLE